MGSIDAQQATQDSIFECSVCKPSFQFEALLWQWNSRSMTTFQLESRIGHHCGQPVSTCSASASDLEPDSEA